MTPFTFTRHNRTPRTILILICVYAALAALLILFDAAWWLVGLLALSTLPALWDVVHGTRAGMTLDHDRIKWFSGNREGEIPLADIDYIRFDTRWDFSVRVSLVLASGKRIRLPDESTPPHKEFEITLQEVGFRVERHHFTVF
ncbi:hypothetical protein [Ruegeria arenilitoris]|uniref:hypothetical protein n=1 Tax=Ruegeria arenilitoris TaxID=1173585 RepID=UPI001479BA17|nr:hypothetical protein [Ruegeria arenilitoris]